MQPDQPWFGESEFQGPPCLTTHWGAPSVA